MVWATDDLIEQNPELVKRVIKAWLEAVKYLKENPSYASDIYMRRTNAPKDVADKAVSVYKWTPSGRGSGNDLVLAVKNQWGVQVDLGALPANINLKIEDAVDIRFLP